MSTLVTGLNNSVNLRIILLVTMLTMVGELVGREGLEGTPILCTPCLCVTLCALYFPPAMPVIKAR